MCNDACDATIEMDEQDDKWLQPLITYVQFQCHQSLQTDKATDSPEPMSVTVDPSDAA